MWTHLSNCHGEWSLLLSFLAFIPFVGVWFKFLRESIDD